MAHEKTSGKGSKKSTTKELESRIEELEEDLKRTHADVINIRRRSEQDKITIGTYAKRDVISKLLPVIDNLDRALANTSDDLKSSDFVKGIVAVQKQLESTLKEMEIERIKTVGEEFNPETMEAVAVDGEGDKEIVAEELQAGYNLTGQNIRHAIVKVAKC